MSDASPPSEHASPATVGDRPPVATQPTVDASTIVLARDGEAGVEVFLLERHLDSDFAGGAYVFPGGKVDETDRTLPSDRWTGLDPAAGRDLVGAADDATALGLYVAAVRETFEEAGVLLATRNGVSLHGADLDRPEFAQARARMNERGVRWDWTPWLVEHDLVLDLGAIEFFSWWVTPDGMHRRYDTRFFVAEVPPGQERHLAADAVETTAERWMTPGAALQAAAAGDVTIIYPTRRNLTALSGFPSAAALVSTARAGDCDRRRIQPTIELAEDGTARVRHPFDGTVDVF